MNDFEESNLFYKNRLALLEEENKQLKERLLKVQENEKKYRMFFEKSKDPFLLIKDFKFVDANSAALRFLKIQSLEELSNTHPASISPEFQDDGKSSIVKANEMINIAITKGFNSFEWKHINSEGKPFDVIVSLTPIVINNELFIFTHWLDYSEYKKREVESNVFQNIIDAVVDRHIGLISITDPNGLMLFTSKNIKTILGYEYAEIINKESVFNLIHPDDLIHVYDIYSKSFKSKTSNCAFLRYRKKDGSYCIIETFGSIIFNDKKEIEKVIYISYILKEEHPSISNMESHFLLNNYMDIIPSPAIIFQSNRIMYLNKASENLLGWDTFEIAGKDGSAIFENKDKIKNTFEKLTYNLKEKSIFTERKISIRKKNGEIISTTITIVPANPEFDNDAYIVFINQEEEEKKVQSGGTSITAEIEASNLKNLILDNLSYELRTPLNGIIGAAQYLKTYVLSKDDRKFAELISESSTKLLRTLTSIIDLSELEAGTKTIFPTSIDLVELLNALIASFAQDADFKALYLSLDTNLTEAKVFHDPLVITNILKPLIDNAIKFTKYGEVTLSLSKCSNINQKFKYIIKVKDTGIGIEDQQFNSIFEAFKKPQVHANRKFTGLGVGLAIVKKYADLGQIDIDFTSQVGFGTVFSIYIPDFKED
ncbi:MAG: PAS domain S-box protein [Chloroherpetonaceae bacterium]